MQDKIFQRNNTFSSILRFLIPVGLLAVFTLTLSSLLAGRSILTQKRDANEGHASAAQQMLNTPTNITSQTNLTANWTQYDDTRYSLQHPRNWVVDGGYDTYYQGRVLTIKSPSQNVQIKLYPK